MLEHVTANQTRFVAPGLAADPRGVALGRFAVVLLPSLDRVIGFFRALSGRTSVDDLLPELRLTQVRTPLSSREFVVQLPLQSSSFVADSVAAVAGLMGGLTFTGSSKHFVQYRDGRSPLGYDVGRLSAEPGDYLLYAVDFTQSYRVTREISLARLALELSPEPEPDDAPAPDEQTLLRVVPGLWRAVAGYLRRRNVPCAVAACQPEGSGGSGPAARLYLMQVQLPAQMVGLFRQTPGVELYRLKTERVAVQLGYRHPFELSACSALFDAERFYLFSGARDTLEEVQRPAAFTDARALVRLTAGPPPAEETLRGLSADGPLQVPLRLVRSSGRTPAVRGSRIPLEQVPWLKRLVYLLPPTLLQQTLACLTTEHVYLYSEGALDLLPLGELLHETAPGVLVPLGWQLVPRVHPEVLLQHLQGESGIPVGERLFVFQPGQSAPLALPRDGFAPLSRQVLAPLSAERVWPRTDEERPARSPGAPALVNDPVGLFPLWGFSPEVDPGQEPEDD